MPKDIPIDEFSLPDYHATIFSISRFRDQRSDAEIARGAPTTERDWDRLRVISYGISKPPARTTLAGFPDRRFKNLGGFDQKSVSIIDFYCRLLQIKKFGDLTGSETASYSGLIKLESPILGDRSPGIICLNFAWSPIYYRNGYDAFCKAVDRVGMLLEDVRR